MKRGLAAVLVAAGLAVPAAASGSGTCAHNQDMKHACPINSPATVTGSSITDDQFDYTNAGDFYVFHARAGTKLDVTITDTENPGCFTGSPQARCGQVRVELDDAHGNPVYVSDASSPSNQYTTGNNAAAVPISFSETLKKGNYFLKVFGARGRDANGSPTSVPYRMQVKASPKVTWPAPPPYRVKRCHTVYVRKNRGPRGHTHRVRVRVTTCHTVTVYP